MDATGRATPFSPEASREVSYTPPGIPLLKPTAVAPAARNWLPLELRVITSIPKPWGDEDFETITEADASSVAAGGSPRGDSISVFNDDPEATHLRHDVYKGHFWQKSPACTMSPDATFLKQHQFYPITPLGAGGNATVYLGRRIEEEPSQKTYGPRRARKISSGGDLPSTEWKIALSKSPYVAEGYAPSPRILDMEYLPGVVSPDPSRAYEIALFLLEALADVRAKTLVKYVHRDIKWDNLRIGQDGQYRLADWGSALAEGEIAGEKGSSACSMAPETIRKHPVSSKEDVWAIGVMVFQCLTGKYHPLFASDKEVTIEQMMWRLNQLAKGGIADYLEGDLSHLDPKWANLLRSFLHPSPDVRPSLEEALKRLKELEAPLMLPPRPLPRGDSALPTESPSSNQLFVEKIAELRHNPSLSAKNINQRLLPLAAEIKQAPLSDAEKRALYRELTALRQDKGCIPDTLGEGCEASIRKVIAHELIWAEKISREDTLPEQEKLLATSLCKTDENDPCFAHLPRVLKVDPKSYTLEYLPYPLKLHLKPDYPLPQRFELAKEILSATCHALAAASRLMDTSLVHQDIKADNFRRREDGSLVLIDWGFAQEAETLRTKVQGSPQTTAPEHLSRERISPAQDAWAVGILMYQVLTGRWHPLLEEAPSQEVPVRPPAASTNLFASKRATPVIPTPTRSPREDWLIEYTSTYGKVRDGSPEWEEKAEAFREHIRQDVAMFLEVAPEERDILMTLQGLLDPDPEKRLSLRSLPTS